MLGVCASNPVIEGISTTFHLSSEDSVVLCLAAKEDVLGLALLTPVLKAAKEIIIFETVGTLVIVAVQKLDSKASRFAPNASLYNINLCPHFISYHQEEKKLLGHVSCA